MTDGVPEDLAPAVVTGDATARALGARAAVPLAGGVDESLIRRHLELPMAERIREIERLYEAGREIARAGERARGELA